ncbi:hypothetical protein [Streptomyces sp. NPDC085529]|uniref:hypothetical protein n=1 Tax=Streptomyces sp. NPDC085529 TaxID=3365729 RepID=UPI0037CD7D3F
MHVQIVLCDGFDPLDVIAPLRRAPSRNVPLGPRIAHAVESLFAHERRGTVRRAEGPAPVAV